MNMEFYLKRRMKPHEGHWIWRLSKNTEGYGHFKFKGVLVLAHRVSYETFIGPIPDDKPQVLHKRGICHIRHCINPDHLYVGTQQDNVDDLMADGRHGTLTIPDNIIAEIRRRCSMGELQKDVAVDLNISRGYVGMIVNFKWRV